jgi:hypothetical protein
VCPGRETDPSRLKANNMSRCQPPSRHAWPRGISPTFLPVHVISSEHPPGSTARGPWPGLRANGTRSTVAYVGSGVGLAIRDETRNGRCGAPRLRDRIRSRRPPGSHPGPLPRGEGAGRFGGSCVAIAAWRASPPAAAGRVDPAGAALRTAVAAQAAENALRTGEDCGYAEYARGCGRRRHAPLLPDSWPPACQAVVGQDQPPPTAWRSMRHRRPIDCW